MPNITILAVGSRGDVQPFVALGVGLQVKGYQVRIAAACDYEALVHSYGLAFAPLVGHVHDVIDPDAIYAVRDGGRHLVRVARSFFGTAGPLFMRLLQDCWQACADADALIVSTLGVYCGYDIAEKLGIPFFVAHFHPASPTRTIPHAFFPVLPAWLPLGGAYNRLSYALADQAFWQCLRGPLNKARRNVLELPPVSVRELVRRMRRWRPTVLCGYSSLIAPPPSDWRSHVHVTGYWLLDHLPDWQPSLELQAFLQAGAPPVYVGFGSIWLGRDGDKLTRLVIEALERTGKRGLLYAGWGDVGNLPLPPTVLRINTVPHDWLFKRVAAVVHHGGAGSTAAALHAGVPSVVVPFLGDQSFWGERVATLGVGVTSIPFKQLTVERLADALSHAADDSLIRAHAQTLSRSLEAEHGVAHAVGIIDRELSSYTAGRSSCT